MAVCARANQGNRPEESFDVFNANVFGVLNVVRAFSPYLRAQQSGVIANISSIGAWQGLPGCGLYCATKSAVATISEALTAELEPFGVTVTAIEPGYFRTSLLSSGNRIKASKPITEYDGTTAHNFVEFLNSADRNQPGDAVKGCKVLIDILTKSGSAANRPIPPRLLLGADAYDIVGKKCKDFLASTEEWKDVTTVTNHADVQ